MYHCVPYVILILIFIPIVVWTIFHKRELGLISVFFTYVGMVYIVEFFILVLFDSYCYKPMMLSVPYYDNILGAVISDLVAVPAIALVIAAFRLNNIWVVVFGVMFGGIEWLFLNLRVYELHWWKIPYTVVGFGLFFMITRLWLKKIRERYHPVIHFLSLFFPSFTLIATILFAVSVLNLHLDHIGLFTDMYRDSVFVSSIYGTAEAVVFSAAQYWFHKSMWWNMSAVVFSLLLEFILEQVGIIDVLVRPWLYYFVQFGCSLLLVVLLFYMNRWFMHLMPQRSSTARS